jgi:hypothetical protein
VFLQYFYKLIKKFDIENLEKYLKISQIYTIKSKKIPQKFPISLLRNGEISPPKNTVPYVFISISFKCLKCYVLMFPILIAQLIVSS